MSCKQSGPRSQERSSLNETRSGVSNPQQATLPSVTTGLGTTPPRRSTAGLPRPSRTRAPSPFPVNSLGVVRGAGRCACSTRPGGARRGGPHSSGGRGRATQPSGATPPAPGAAVRVPERRAPHAFPPEASRAHCRPPRDCHRPSENQRRHVFASRRKAGDQSWTPARRY